MKPRPLYTPEKDWNPSCLMWIIITLGAIFLCNAMWTEIINYIKNLNL